MPGRSAKWIVRRARNAARAKEPDVLQELRLTGEDDRDRTSLDRLAILEAHEGLSSSERRKLDVEVVERAAVVTATDISD